MPAGQVSVAVPLAGQPGGLYLLHLLGAVPEYGKLGFTSIGDSAEEAAELHQRTLRALNQSA